MTQVGAAGRGIGSVGRGSGAEAQHHAARHRALLLDLGDHHGADLARARHMGAAAGLQVDLRGVAVPGAASSDAPPGTGVAPLSRRFGSVLAGRRPGLPTVTFTEPTRSGARQDETYQNGSAESAGGGGTLDEKAMASSSRIIRARDRISARISKSLASARTAFLPTGPTASL